MQDAKYKNSKVNITKLWPNRQPTLPLSIRINMGSLYRNVSILNYKRDKDNVS